MYLIQLDGQQTDCMSVSNINNYIYIALERIYASHFSVFLFCIVKWGCLFSYMQCIEINETAIPLSHCRQSIFQTIAPGTEHSVIPACRGNPFLRWRHAFSAYLLDKITCTLERGQELLTAVSVSLSVGKEDVNAARWRFDVPIFLHPTSVN